MLIGCQLAFYKTAIQLLDLRSKDESLKAHAKSTARCRLARSSALIRGDVSRPSDMRVPFFCFCLLLHNR